MEDDERYIETMRLLVDQTRLDQKIKKEGFEEQDLMKQIDINKRRNKFDIVDREEIIYINEDENKEFVQ